MAKWYEYVFPGVGSLIKSGTKAVEKGVKNLTGANERDRARQDYEAGQEAATNYVRGGFGRSRGDLKKYSYYEPLKDINKGFSAARGDLSSGFDTASGRYGTPEATQTKEQLLNRAIGRGGFSPEQIDLMKANAREEFGTSLREGVRNINPYYGDSYGGGITGEKVGRFVADIAGRRASATRDIDIQNATRARDEQAGAISELNRLTAEQSQLDIGKGQGLSGLSQNRASALANLSQALGINLTNLSTEEAELLANIATGGAAQTVSTRKTAGYMNELAQLAEIIGAAKKPGGTTGGGAGGG